MDAILKIIKSTETKSGNFKNVLSRQNFSNLLYILITDTFNETGKTATLSLNQFNHIDGGFNSQKKRLVNLVPLKENKDSIHNIESYSYKWMLNICNELNYAALAMPIEYGGGVWSPEKFKSAFDLIEYHLTMDAGIYEYINNEGLLNTGYCPITGEKINNSSYFYSMFDRKVFLSKAGKKNGKERNPKLYKKKKEILESLPLENRKKWFWRLFAGLVIILLIKACQ